MKHGSLFSGIGGFDLAAKWMGWENIFHCEFNKKCQALLNKRFPGSIGYGDIKEVDFTSHANTIDIISGGFPCQPFSTAGKRKGTEDDRHLWPEMLRAIGEIQPSWVVGENVRGLVNWSKGLVFDQVQADLEAQGYEVLPFLLPACSVNAPHRRDRIWFIAHSDGAKSANRQRTDREQTENRQRTDREQTEEIWRENKSNVLGELPGVGITSDSSTKGLSERFQEGFGCVQEADESFQRSEFTRTLTEEYWREFPTQSPVCRGNDGIPNRMDRLKQLGNAIVPQVALQIFKTIEQYEKHRA